MHVDIDKAWNQISVLSIVNFPGGAGRFLSLLADADYHSV